ACGVREEVSRPIFETLVENLGARQTLLILDSCEHLVEPCALLAESVLRSCRKLKILVTSREPLGVAGELIWRTPSLSLPKPEDGGHSELVLESEAVRLYIDRAQLSEPGFDLTESGSAAAVAQICTRLEGIPLAIELAASLTRVMTTQEILERLRDRFRLLTGGGRSALSRHQTLRQAVDWSYGLLSPLEKALLATLSLFVGGFDIAAAEAVAPEETLDSGGVMPLLSRLVDKSLVSAEAAGSNRTRYRMLDTIREYALEKLQQGVEADARHRHARYFVDLCGRAGRGLRGPEPLPWLQRLDEEQANIRLALGWSMVEQPDDAVRLAATMGAYWHMRRHFAEGAEWLGQALELATPRQDARAAALWTRARIRGVQGQYAAARRDAEECVELSRKLGLSLELGGALNILGLVSAAGGNLDEGERLTGEALQLAQEGREPEIIAGSLNNLALFASARGEHERGRSLLEEALRQTRIAGNQISAANILDSLGRVTLLLGDVAAARLYYQESLQMSTRFEDILNLAECLEGIALVFLAEKNGRSVICMIAAANNLRIATGAKAMPTWQVQVDDGLAAARALLGARASEAAWQEGSAMTVPEAIRYTSGAAPGPGHVDGNPLTARETQVAGLISEGLTNAEIAKRLQVADRTADAHVEHIRNKLGLRTRSQIAVWAHERLGTG
ncbi:MAG TPA: LuxR C-terminal-related transcriptional regulator, partial [Candidatus Dormibacteraeota bacterium]